MAPARRGEWGNRPPRSSCPVATDITNEARVARAVRPRATREGTHGTEKPHRHGLAPAGSTGGHPAPRRDAAPRGRRRRRAAEVRRQGRAGRPRAQGLRRAGARPGLLPGGPGRRDQDRGAEGEFRGRAGAERAPEGDRARLREDGREDVRHRPGRGNDRRGAGRALQQGGRRHGGQARAGGARGARGRHPDHRRGARGEGGGELRRLPRGPAGGQLQRLDPRPLAGRRPRRRDDRVHRPGGSSRPATT